MSDDRHRRTPRAIRAAQWLLVLLVAAVVAHVAFGSDGGVGETIFMGVVYAVALVLAGGLCLARGLAGRGERWPWLLFGAGVLAWTAGDVYWWIALSGLEEAPYPSLADACWFAMYPLVFVAGGLLVRARIASFAAHAWLDGLIAAAVAAACLFAFFDPVAAGLGGEPAAVATNLAYPLLDGVLVALVVGAAAVGRRFDSTWLLLVAGLALFAVVDSAYLYLVAVDAYDVGHVIDLGWLGGLALVGLAAWRPARARRRLSIEGWAALVPPALFGLVGVGILTYDHFVRIPTSGLALAALGMAFVILRFALTFRDHLHVLGESREEAVTDALTGLGNRRALMDALEDVDVLADEASWVLALYDLDGFKGYNDLFGHLAGDALLQRLARKLEDAVSAPGRAYRLGGDEFCILAPARDGSAAGRVAAAAGEALSDRGERFAVGASYGCVLIPAEARGAAEALRLADGRMYAQKAGRLSPFRQVWAALATALEERDGTLGAHADEVSRLATAVGRELGLEGLELDELTAAAELHDIGKLGIPEAILAKPGPLSADEWEFVRRHPTIGERIARSTPSLTPVARIIRSTHERWDGGGYPDGLRGTGTPLPARIICACDAFDAMTSPTRPYRAQVSREGALEELRQCAGTQFDPAVVAALERVVRERRSEDAVAGGSLLTVA